MMRISVSLVVSSGRNAGRPGVSEQFSEIELRQLLDLSSRLGWNSGVIARKRTLLHGLCKLVGGVTGWSALLSDDFSVVGNLTAVRFASDDAFARPMTAEAMPPSSGTSLFSFENPLVKPFLDEAARRWLEPTALARVEAIDDGKWYSSPFFQQVMAPVGLDDCILSTVPLSGLQPFIAVVCLAGPLGELRRNQPYFTAHQRRLVEIAHSALRWIYYPHPQLYAEQLGNPNSPAEIPGQLAPTLAPRLRKILACLLAGSSEKELACQLGLSKHTIHEYVRQIYKKFSVNSRGELMARWVSSDTTPPTPAQTPSAAS
jgi:DNA-binding CsgD family transcriptional regulator